ncbi:MAG TPA: ABC transporter permease [Geothermobacteraceae bacterium]|nr:ABC transporter permease [Geothermobacteraceae bacterium]
MAIKNKTVFLILFIPFFVFISLDFIDQPDVNAGNVKIGLIRNDTYAPAIRRNITTAGKIITVTWVQTEMDGQQLLKEKKIDGVLLGNTHEPGSLTLLVLKSESLQTLAIVESLSALQQAAEGGRESWITGIEALYAGGIQRQTLPTWILMIVLLVGFIILPAQVAEEKEKKLLLALLQTPISEVQWLLAKVLTGMILIVVAVSILHLLGGFGVANFPYYVAFIGAGGFCFSAFGISLGFLCRTQASARTLGVIIYLPHLLPSALSEYSQQLTAVAPLLPSYQIYEPLKSILLEDGTLANMPYQWFYLMLVGSLAVYLSQFLMKKRWLMK